MEVLAEIPRQMSEYYQFKNLNPKQISIIAKKNQGNNNNGNNNGNNNNGNTSNPNANANIRFAWSKKIDANNFAFSERETDFEVISKSEALDGENEVQTILTKNLYGMARAFIEELGNI